MKNTELREKEYFSLLNQLEEEHYQAINNLDEVNYSIYCLEELKKIDKESSILFPVLNGILIEGKIKKAREVKVNVGAGVMTTKSVDEVISMLKAKQKELKARVNKIKVQIDNITRLIQK